MVVRTIALVLSLYGSIALAAPVQRSAAINANVAGAGLTIPSNFVGISGEVGDFTAGFYQGISGSWTSNGFTGNAASYISLVGLLGAAGSFRLGGGSSDAGTAPAISAGMATNINSFLGGLGASWKLIYGLDLVANDTATAATTAANLATAVGVNNVVFQFGNEPSINGFTSAQYITRWNAYYTAVTGSVASAKVGSVDDIINIGWGVVPTVVASLTPAVAGMSFISQHWYSFCNGTWPSAVPAILLQSAISNQLGNNLFGAANNGAGYLSNDGATGATPQRMSETNSICSRGQLGMSDRLMAATWFINVAATLASQGWAGMNIHSVWTGGIGAYNPVLITADQNFTATPVFYGMFLFSKIQGQQIVPSSVGGNANVQAIATKGANGNANIIAVNNDVNNPVTVTPTQSAAWTTANVLMVKDNDGNGCGSASPVVGGQPIGESGAWSGTPFSIANGGSISIPPCGAALIQIQP